MAKKTYLKATFNSEYCQRYSYELFDRHKGEIIGFEHIEKDGQMVLAYIVSFGSFTEYIYERAIENGLFEIIEE